MFLHNQRPALYNKLRLLIKVHNRRTASRYSPASALYRTHPTKPMANKAIRLVKGG